MSEKAASNQKVPPISGTLKRKSFFFGIYQTVFCVLNNTTLEIRKNQSATKIEKRISIKPTTQIRVFENEKVPRFMIINDGESDACFACESPDEAMTWVVALRSATFQDSEKLSMDSFEIVSVIGRGFYGKVMLCKMKKDGNFYAIKSIHKSKLITTQNVHTVFNERNIMVKAKHPFIVELFYAFQTSVKFYLVMEYAPGGELFRHIRNRIKLDLSQIRLYIAEIALALDYLHSIGVVYRDLKTENILLSADGHIKLADFGMSKDLSVIEVTTTFCGTLDYIAPEIIRRESYSYPIDWWALGILTYELMFGYTPFLVDTGNNRAKICQAITSDDPKFPKNVDKDAIDFISKLLIKEPKKRATFKSLKKHPFWKGLNFQDVLNKKYQPAFIPETSGNEPINFAQEFTEEPAADSISSFGTSHDTFPGFSYSGMPDYETESIKDIDVNLLGITPSILNIPEDLNNLEEDNDSTEKDDDNKSIEQDNDNKENDINSDNSENNLDDDNTNTVITLNDDS